MALRRPLSFDQIRKPFPRPISPTPDRAPSRIPQLKLPPTSHTQRRSYRSFASSVRPASSQDELSYHANIEAPAPVFTDGPIFASPDEISPTSGSSAMPIQRYSYRYTLTPPRPSPAVSQLSRRSGSPSKRARPASRSLPEKTVERSLFNGLNFDQVRPAATWPSASPRYYRHPDSHAVALEYDYEIVPRFGHTTSPHDDSSLISVDGREESPATQRLNRVVAGSPSRGRRLSMLPREATMNGGDTARIRGILKALENESPEQIQQAGREHGVTDQEQSVRQWPIEVTPDADRIAEVAPENEMTGQGTKEKDGCCQCGVM